MGIDTYIKDSLKLGLSEEEFVVGINLAIDDYLKRESIAMVLAIGFLISMTGIVLCTMTLLNRKTTN